MMFTTAFIPRLVLLYQPWSPNKWVGAINSAGSVLKEHVALRRFASGKNQRKMKGSGLSLANNRLGGADNACSVDPACIFLPKFENAGELARSQYAEMDSAETKETHILVAAVKSSGSLWLMTVMDGKMICSSKNGVGNVYSVAGHYTFILHFQKVFGDCWQEKYRSCLVFLDNYNLSLGCELVVRCLGEHGSTPNTDHLVVNAVLDRKTLRPCSPVLLVHLQTMFALQISGMYFYDNSATFYNNFDKIQYNRLAKWADVDETMKHQAVKVVPMDYAKIHSTLVEGFVCSWIPLSPNLEQWLAMNKSRSGKISKVADEGIADLCNPSIGYIDGHGDVTLARQSGADLQLLAWPSVSDLSIAAGADPDRLLKAMEDRIKDLGSEFAPYSITPANGETSERISTALAVLLRGRGSSETTALFQKMICLLDRLALPYSLKFFEARCHQEGTASTAENYFGVVTLRQDWAFRKYEDYCTEHPEEENPPLLRGNIWRIRLTQTEVAQQGMNGDMGSKLGQQIENEFDNFRKVSLPACLARRGQRLSSSLFLVVVLASRNQYFRAMFNGSYAEAAKYRAWVQKITLTRIPKQGGAIPGKTWKFKLLSYTHRTFLLRNCGISLAKTRNYQAYIEQYERHLQVWSVPSQAAAELRPIVERWGRFIMSLGLSQLQQLQDGSYLDLLEQMERRKLSASETTAGAQGLYIFLSFFPETRQIAKDFAESINPHLAVTDGQGLDQKQMRFMCDTEGIVFGLVQDGTAQKIANMVHKLPLKRMPIIICLVGVNKSGAKLAADRNDANADTFMKFSNMANNLSKIIEGPLKGAGVRVISVSQADFETDGGKGSTAGTRGLEIQNRLKTAMAVRLKHIATFKQEELCVVLFVTMVGWGKNTLCKAFMERLPDLGTLGFESDGPHQKADSKAVKSKLVLESDELKKRFWPEVQQAISNYDLRILILNRNFPPNSWAPTVTKLLESAREHDRKIRVIAVVPGCTGSPSNAFSLRHFAVCLHSIQNRKQHPAGLDKENQETAKVASMFYNLYNMQGGRSELIRQVQVQLGATVIEVPWLVADEAALPMPLALQDSLEKIVVIAESQPAEAERLARQAFSDPASVKYVTAARLPSEKVADGMIDAMRLAWSKPNNVERIQKQPKYISLDLDYTAVTDCLEQTKQILPQEFAPKFIGLGNSGKKLHVTLWHTAANGGAGVIPPESLTNLEGKTFSVQPAFVVADGKCVAISVQMCSKEVPTSFNTWPHITIWTAAGVPKKYSNELLARLGPAEAILTEGDYKGKLTTAVIHGSVVLHH